ncbi:hypothetical protein ACFLY3_00475 [Chloroflexota bacterium]
MRHQTLRMAASCLGILTWVVVAVGVIVSLIIGIGAATAVAKVSFLLGGFVLTAILGLMLLVTSKLIYLLIEIEEDLSKIADNTKQKK